MKNVAGDGNEFTSDCLEGDADVFFYGMAKAPKL
jgi:hypothetical protein